MTEQEPKKKRKHDKTKLPTPPPDPISETKDKDKDVFEYLEALQKNQGLRAFAPAIVTEEAFDHLEKLYKLMEQMLELREENAKLHRRIRDLEYLNNLEKMQKSLEIDQPCPDLEKDTAFAETILESILSDSKKPPPSSAKPRLLRRQRTFSKTDPEKPSKVSKWTKVKAAFKWEKASAVSDSKSQDSGVSGMLPVNVEIARYLRVPSTSDEAHSPADSGAAEISTPASLSTASSNEDFHRHELRTRLEDFRSSEDEQPHYIPHSKDDRASQKGSIKSHHRTTWAKMKDIISTRNSLKKKHRLSAQSDDIQIDVELCSDEDVFEDDSKNKSPSAPSTPLLNVRSSSDIPLDVITRYQRALALESKSDEESKKVSKWTRVKQAFLTSDPSTSTSHSPRTKEEAPSPEEEIRRNYKQLQKKLSLEFQEKMNEWERLKQASPSSPSGSFFEEPRDYAKRIKCKSSIKMTKPEDLSADFKKKLQEWEKLKRENMATKKKIGQVPRWKSVSGSSRDPPPLSEEFRKKLEEWKQIKAGELKKLKEKTPSPKLSRKNSSPRQSKKKDSSKDWFMKELLKIEREKQRLEGERVVFLEREETLSKLRRTVTGSAKKEVLIHTPTGSHRFEGISRKFTQKLYEWEKAQGIAPEASTFALLTSGYVPEVDAPKKTSTPSLIRSKSADSVAVSSASLTCPIIKKQPSSLSLNDVDDLEKGCLSEYLDDDEPEALIVEVEDYVEETASPLRTFVEQQKPIYQRQEVKALCEGETVRGPKVRRSESTRAQVNYNLIEQVFDILRILQENELKPNCKNSKQQEELSRHMVEKVELLSEANDKLVNAILKGSESKKISETSEAILETSSEILSFANKLVVDFEKDLVDSETILALGQIKSKLLDLRRYLSYVCAASDSTVPQNDKKVIQKTLSNESKDSRCDTSDNSRRSSGKERYIKSENCNVQSGQGAVKKRIKYRQKCLQSRSIPDTDEEDENLLVEQRKKHKKLIRTKSVSDKSEMGDAENDLGLERVNVKENIINDESDSTEVLDSPVGVFVKTTRKLFTPIGESSIGKSEEAVSHLPPLPGSPISTRKTAKEISPSIRLMLSKYNQKISEHESLGKSASSGSASPIAWRSPTAERRVKAQTEKYQLELTREVKKSASAVSMVISRSPIPVQRACSYSNTALAEEKKKQSLTLDIAQAQEQVREAMKLPTEIRLRKLQQAKEEFLNSTPTTPISAPSEQKELNFPSRNRLSQISVDSESSYDSVAAGVLVKSASAGMINVDPNTYKQFTDDGFVSLPRAKKLGRFAFANIASKFRKVKMRKGKEKKEMNVVSTLCRQSLVVDINAGEEQKSWLQKHNLFKK